VSWVFELILPSYARQLLENYQSVYSQMASQLRWLYFDDYFRLVTRVGYLDDGWIRVRIDTTSALDINMVEVLRELSWAFYSISEIGRNVDNLKNALASAGVDKLRVSVVDALPESPLNIARVGGVAVTGRDWSSDFAMLQNLDIALSGLRDSTLSSQLRWLYFDDSFRLVTRVGYLDDGYIRLRLDGYWEFTGELLRELSWLYYSISEMGRNVDVLKNALASVGADKLRVSVVDPLPAPIPVINYDNLLVFSSTVLPLGWVKTVCPRSPYSIANARTDYGSLARDIAVELHKTLVYVRDLRHSHDLDTHDTTLLSATGPGTIDVLTIDYGSVMGVAELVVYLSAYASATVSGAYFTVGVYVSADGTTWTEACSATIPHTATESYGTVKGVDLSFRYLKVSVSSTYGQTYYTRVRKIVIMLA
jgi:DNA-binding transcriptional ArsR family regulator